MTKKEFERRAHLERSLMMLGFNVPQVEALRKASNTLQRWYENECNGVIQRDEVSEIPYRHNTYTGEKLYKVADLETGARKRIDAIVGTVPSLSVYIQTDPRGAALYIIRPDDVPVGEDVGSYYSRGICVY